MTGGLVTLGMIGGAINQPTPEIISEYLPVTKLMSGGGGLGPLMQRVMSGGLASVVPNPMAALGGQLQGAIGQGLTALQGVPGAGALSTALGGLSMSTGGILAAGDALLAGPGALSIMSHANMAAMAGSALPAGAEMGVVLGPLNADAALGQIAAAVPVVVAGVVAGSMSASAAASQIAGHAAELDGIVAASTDALATINDRAPDIAGLHTVAAVFVSGPPEYRAVLERSIAPADQDAIVASLATHVEPA